MSGLEDLFLFACMLFNSSSELSSKEFDISPPADKTHTDKEKTQNNSNTVYSRNLTLHFLSETYISFLLLV